MYTVISLVKYGGKSSSVVVVIEASKKVKLLGSLERVMRDEERSE